MASTSSRSAQSASFGDTVSVPAVRGDSNPVSRATAVGAPTTEPAVEHGDAFDAGGGEQPPQACRPVAEGGVVDDDGDVVVDAELARDPLEPRGIRPRERVRAVGVRELLEEVGEHRSRHVARDQVVVEAAEPAESGRRLDAEHAGVDDDESRVTEMGGEPLRRDEVGGQVECGHVDTLVAVRPRVIGCRNRP